MQTFLVPLSLLAGALLAVQAGANAQLAKSVGSPFAATTLQLSVGSLVLAVAMLLTNGHLTLADLPQVPWWHAVGGTASAFYVVSTVLLFPRIGAVVTAGLLIASQMLASLALDAFGLLGVAPKDIGSAALVGMAMVLGGAGAIVFGQREAAGAAGSAKAGWIMLALAAGAVLPVQGAVNGLLRADLGAPFAVGAVSFVVATLSMGAVLLGSVLFAGASAPTVSGLSGMPWWGWLGGFAGATYVMTVFTAIPAIGASSAIGLTVAGQQIAAIFVDRYGWFRLPKRPIRIGRLVGVGLLLAGVAVLKAF